MEEKAPQEICLEMLKHVASANLAMSVEMANNVLFRPYCSAERVNAFAKHI